MNQTPETRESLLLRVRDRDDDASWRKFVSIYRPVIYRIARRQDLQDSDAEDLSQRVLMSVSRAIGGWQKDPQRGSFRSWLSIVTRNAIINLVTRGPKDAAVGGTDFLLACNAVESATDAIDELIQSEHARSQLRLAAAEAKREVEPRTWNAFWWTTIEGRSIADVADELNLSAGAVYGARARVMKRLQSAAAAMKQGDNTGEAS